MGVMSGKTHVEHNESALILIADMPADMDFRCNGPETNSCTAISGLFDNPVGEGEQ